MCIVKLFENLLEIAARLLFIFRTSKGCTFLGNVAIIYF